MLRNRVLFGAAAALVACLGVASPQFAVADEIVPMMNNHDENYGFSFNFWWQTADTSFYDKEEPTSTYLYVSSLSDNSMRLYVNGATTKSGSGKKNCTNGGYVNSPRVTGGYEIHNGVYEYGYRFANLGASSDYGPGSLHGVWSPDCAGNYTDLN